MFTPKEGARINNYLLESRAGMGSFGEVWRARHHVFGNVVAVKIPTDREYVRNLQREGVAIHGLKHPNIVRAIDLDPYADPPYLIMEYVDGPSLRQVIDARGATLAIPAVVAVMRGVLSALAAAHDAGLVHRDIKPANILLNHSLEQVDAVTQQAVRVTDFGLGRIGGETAQNMVQSGSLLTEEGRTISGTLAYMSPEQREGLEIDARSDLYSCGIVLFEMLTAERPQGTELPGSIRRDAPKQLDEVFRRSYTRLERRYPSARAMLDDLRADPLAPPPPPVHPAAVGRRICGGCGGSVHARDQFCIRCGKQLVASVPRCPKCKAYLDVNDRFCIFCGNDLRVLSG